MTDNSNNPNLNEGEDFYYSSPISQKSIIDTLKEIEEEEKRKAQTPPPLTPEQIYEKVKRSMGW